MYYFLMRERYQKAKSEDLNAWNIKMLTYDGIEFCRPNKEYPNKKTIN